MNPWPGTADSVAAAVAHLRGGGVLGLPTETVYGLAADATQAAAVARVFATKGRPADHPLIVHVADLAAARPWARDWPVVAERLAAAFWPGPLTLVLPRGPQVLAAVTGGQDSVALRVPAHPLAQAVLRAFGGALVAPSANRYGQVSPTRAADVVTEYGGAVPVLDGGACAVGLESTIVACLDGRALVLRPGSLTPGMLSRASGAEILLAAAGQGPRAPGTTRAHYAPRTPLELVPAAALYARALALPAAVVVARSATLRCGLAAQLRERPSSPPLQAMPDEAAAYGRVLYATLRDLDRLEASRLLVEAVPEDEVWGAVRDRLQRAAAAGEVEETVDGR